MNTSTKIMLLLCIVFWPFALVWLLWIGLVGLAKLMWLPIKLLKR